MRTRNAVGALACAATLCLGSGMAAIAGAGAGAGAATPAPKLTPAAAARPVEAAAVSSAFAALQKAAHLGTVAARQAATGRALQGLQTAIKAATINVRPTAAAQRNASSPDVQRAVRAMSHPGSAASGEQLRLPASGGPRYGEAYSSGFQTSSNWSGYVDTGESYDYAFGEWTVPWANCGPWYDFNFSQSSTWVGLDGWGSGTVEQLGTATGCVAGASTYYAWTEMYPQIEDPVWNGISPGDQIMAFVYSYAGNTEDELYMADLTQGWSELRFASTSPVADSSAEWITERPSCGPFCNNLTNFGTTTFTDAFAMDNSTFGSIDAFPNAAVDLYTNTYCAEVGGLSNGGTQFTDWWIHS